MAHLRDIVVDCRHPAPVARFWAAVLERLRGMGVNDPEDDPSVLVEAGNDGRPRFIFQRVPEEKVVKNRMHLDIRGADVDAELRRGKSTSGPDAPPPRCSAVDRRRSPSR